MSSAFQNTALLVLLALVGGPIALAAFEFDPTPVELVVGDDPIDVAPSSSIAPSPVQASAAIRPTTTDIQPGTSTEPAGESSRTDSLATTQSAALAPAIAALAPPPDERTPSRRLQRGINIAGDFEVEPRGSWGSAIVDADFADIAAQGFDHVRVPIRWSAHTGPAPDHLIDPGFVAEIDALVDAATLNDLGIVLDVHFFESLEADPVGERDHFLDLWDQIARRYQDTPDSVVFELLNEPVGVFEDQPDVWNALAADALNVIRETNPDRLVIIGPVSWNLASRLPDLVLPNDPNLMTTIHVYNPFEFTHQGAVWSEPVPPTGVIWNPDAAALSDAWLDISWSIDRRPAARPDGGPAMEVQFDEPWSAFALGADRATPHDSLVVELDRAIDAVVLCNFDLPTARILEPTFVAGITTVDVSACGPIERIALQAQVAGTEVTIDRFALCQADTCHEAITTEAGAIDDLIDGAGAWAAEQGVGLYLGEFGTLSIDGDPTDPQSRHDWTRTVREAAERNGAGWSYFTLNDEMGARDQPGVWHDEIITALFD